MHVLRALSLISLAAAACGGGIADEAKPNGAAGSTSAGAAGAGAAGGSSAAGAAGAAGAGPQAGAAGDPGVEGGPPPPDAAAPPGDGTGTNVQAVKHLELGTDPATIYDIAYPVDGARFTTADAPGHCKPREGAKALDVVEREGAKALDVVVDGPNGEDNAFGKLVVPILKGFSPDVQKTLDTSITSGSFSLLIRVEKLGAMKSYNGLSAELFAVDGAKDAMGKAIAPVDWDTYEWEPLANTLDSTAGTGDALHSVVKFPSTYVVDDTWVSGKKGVIGLSLSVSGQVLALEILQSRMAHRLAADRMTASGGVISGVLAAEALGKSVKALAGKVSPALCSGALIDTLVIQIQGAADMMQDGTQNPNAECDGISIGLGYDTTRSKIGKAAPPSTPSSPCK